jgi:hypothetical protein
MGVSKKSTNHPTKLWIGIYMYHTKNDKLITIQSRDQIYSFAERERERKREREGGRRKYCVLTI